MRCARIPQQRRRYFLKSLSGITAILLAAAVCAGQSNPGPRFAQSKPPVAQDLSAFPGLIPEFGQLLVELEKNIQYPAPRAESRLLPLLPESTIFFAALPNYGDAAHQALQIFRQELQENSVLRDWWSHGDMATAGPKLEDSI